MAAQKTPTNGYVLSLEEVQRLQREVQEHRARSQIGKLTDETIAEYERRVEQLRAGVDIGSACKKERYLWKAAGEYGFKTRMRELLREADKVRKAKDKLEAVRMLEWREKVREMGRLVKAWDEFRAVDWAATPDEIIRKQADHKKRAASDAELDAFHAHKAAQTTQYRLHFLAAEFCGARPEEFGGVGVGVELTKHEGKPAMRFWIVGAKQREDAKGDHGQPERTILSPFPAKGGALGMARRWHELAKAAGAAGGKLLLTVEASEKLTAGQKLSRSFSKIAGKLETKRGEPKLSMYSLRNRFSAQAKASNDDPIAVAEVLGHRSTETQRHYGRARRGGSGVSPAQVVSDQKGSIKQVRNYRDRKANPIKPKRAPATPATVSTAMPPSKPGLSSWRAALALPQVPRAPRPPKAA